MIIATLRAVAATGVLLAASVVAVVVSAPAAHAEVVCDQFGTRLIQNGRYVVMNNRWGASTPQCIDVTSTGFTITQANHNNATNGAPASYPAVYLGCHYNTCSTGSNLPIQVSQISTATSSISYTFAGGTFDAAYDIWLDPSPRRDGQNATEIMIWFNRQGSIQPVGSPVGNATVGGRTWQVWQGNPGWNVISYVAPSAIPSWSFSVMDFIADTRSRGAVTNAWYLTSIQAGFEPWIGGAGLAVTNFSAAVNSGGPTTTPPTTQPTTPPTGGSAACKVTYGTNVWNSGFTANVTVANTGSSAINGWNLGFTLPGGQAITSSWNANLTGSSGAITASNVSWNGSIAPGANTSFGFQGTYSGSFANPPSFTLNGSTCTTA
jgi:hypothetical protein